MHAAGNLSVTVQLHHWELFFFLKKENSSLFTLFGVGGAKLNTPGKLNT